MDAQPELRFQRSMNEHDLPLVTDTVRSATPVQPGGWPYVDDPVLDFAEAVCREG
jgi:hypothetical protein